MMAAHTLILAYRRQRQANLCEFEASLIYRVSSRTGSKASERNKTKQNNNKTIPPTKKVRHLVII